MQHFRKIVLFIAVLTVLAILSFTYQRLLIWWSHNQTSPLEERLSAQTLSLGSPVFIRNI